MKVRRWFRAKWRSVKTLPGRFWRWLDWDERDILFLTGLSAMGAGLYGIDWRAALVICGGLLVYVGLFHRRKGAD